MRWAASAAHAVEYARREWGIAGEGGIEAPDDRRQAEGVAVAEPRGDLAGGHEAAQLLDGELQGPCEAFEVVGAEPFEFGGIGAGVLEPPPRGQRYVSPPRRLLLRDAQLGATCL